MVPKKKKMKNSQSDGDTDAEEVIKFQPTDESKDELLLSLQKLQFSGEYADFSIKCGGDTYQVHKAIICPRAPFFRAALKNHTKESEAAEVDLSEHDPTSVRLMVYYLYNLDYPHVKTDGSLGNLQRGSSSKANLSHHCKLYALADFCQMDSLKTLALNKFKNDAEIHWMVPDFVQAVQFVYSATVSTDRSMRDAVIGVMMTHRTLLDRPEFKVLVKEIDLGHELLMKMHEAQAGGQAGTPAKGLQWASCANCGDGHYTVYC